MESLIDEETPKRDSNTGVFRWNLWNYRLYLLLQNTSVAASIYDRSVFGALSNTYDEAFSRNSLQLKAPLTFSQISSIIDKYEILNAKL